MGCPLSRNLTLTGHLPAPGKFYIFSLLPSIELVLIIYNNSHLLVHIRVSCEVLKIDILLFLCSKELLSWEVSTRIHEKQTLESGVEW